MEQEEAIKYLRQIYPNGGHCWLDSQRIEAIEMAISALSQPSLPSNLDEAADTFNREDAARIWDYEGKTEGEIVEAAFKAGAEWMAGQGETREVEVKEDAGGYPYIDKHFELYDYDKDEPLFKAGDKVVVQIRKK